MPLAYQILTEPDLWIVKGIGHVTGEQYFACLESSSNDPAFHWNIDLLLDFRQVGDFDITLDDIKVLQAMELEARKIYGAAGYKIAGLTRNAHDFYQMKLYKALLKDSDIEVAEFKDPEEAIIWLKREKHREAVFQTVASMTVQ